jgi:hypothetical protein
MEDLVEAYLGIYEEFKPLTPEKEKRVQNRVGELVRDIQVSSGNVKSLRKKPFAKFRPEVKKQISSNISTAKRKQNLVQNASDSLIRTSVGREASTRSKINQLKNALGDMEGRNNIKKFNREELEYIIDTLVSEGYVSDYDSAAYILEAMSEEWLESILMEAPYQIYGPDPHGPSDSESRPIGKPYQDKKRAKKRADRLDQEIGGYRHSVKYVEDKK